MSWEIIQGIGPQGPPPTRPRVEGETRGMQGTDGLSGFEIIYYGVDDMCKLCEERAWQPIDVEEELGLHNARLQSLIKMHEMIPEMDDKDKEFAENLYWSYKMKGGLSAKQWVWPDRLVERVQNQVGIEGSYKAILVMFRLAASNGQLKKPKIRLVGAEGRFVQLNFNPEETNVIKVYVDGWQGHGYRKFAGTITETTIKPYSAETMTQEVVDIIQELSLDPARVAKAMAAKLGVCMYCGQRLSDPTSKEVGYGPVCAYNYELPWGGETNKHVDLNSLFG